MLHLRTLINGLLIILFAMSQNIAKAQNCQECDEEINKGGTLIACETFENTAVGNNVLGRPNWNTLPNSNFVSSKISATTTYQGDRAARFEYKANALQNLNFRYNATAPDFDYHIATRVFVPKGKSARIAMLDNNSQTKYIIEFGKNDTAFVKATPTSPATASFRYPKGQWFRLSQMVRFATKKVEVFVGGRQYANIIMPNTTVGLPNNLNFSALASDNDFYIDNICFVKNKGVTPSIICTTQAEAYCVGGVFNDLTNECLLASEGGYIAAEFAKGTCGVTLGCVPTCNISNGCFNYYISKDNKIFITNNYCNTSLATEWSVLADAQNYIFDNGTSKNSKDVVITPSKTGVYTIIQKVKNASGDVVFTCSQNINYNPTLCNESPLINVQTQSLGNGRFLISTNNSQNIENISWAAYDSNGQPTNAGIFVGDNLAPEFFKNKPGLLNIVATANNECGTASTTLQISDATCQAGCGTVVDQIADIKPVANGKTLTFKGLSNTNNYSYKWRIVGFPNINVPANAAPTIDLPDFGNYNVVCEIIKTVGNCVNRAAYNFAVKVEDESQCFNQPCNNIRFYAIPNAAKPLEYTFVAANASNVLSWKIKNLKTNEVTNIISTAGTQTINFADAKFGGAGDYAVAYRSNVAGTIVCCGIKVRIDDPTLCGNAIIRYTYNVAKNEFNVGATPAGGTFLIDNANGEPTNLTNNAIPVPTIGATRTIAYRYQVAPDVFQFCTRKILIANPFECKNIEIDYVASSKTIKFSTKNQPLGSNNFSWSEEDNNKNIGNAATINYPLATTTPCKSFTYALRFFDGQKWILCQAPLSNCNPDDCGTVIQHSYAPNTGNGQLVLTTNSPNISQPKWYIDDAAAVSINKNIKPGKYKISLVYFDTADNTYKICSKSIKIGDDCFQNADCDQLNFYFNNNPTKPLQYTFSAKTTGVVTQWRIRNVKDQKTFIANTGVQQTLDFSQYGGEGEYIICYEYENAQGAEPSGCCCTKVCVSNPYTCGDNSINYEYDALQNRFILSYLGSIAGGNGEWIEYVSANVEPKIIPNGAIPVTNICETKTIGFRFKDATSNCVKICYRTIEVCNPFACKNIKVSFDQNQNTYAFSLLNNTGITKYNWRDETTLTTLSSTATANFGFANAICDKRTIAARYFDGQKWSFCAVDVFHCDPKDCEAFINENIANNKFSSISVNPTFTDVIWYINNAAVGTGNTFDVKTLTPGDYKVSVLFFDPPAKYYRVCTKTITIGDECFTKSDCKDMTFFYTGKSNNDLKYTFKITDSQGLINWQVKQESTGTIANIASVNGTLEIDFNQYGGEGDYTICASKAKGCCCIKVAITNPNNCEDIAYKFNATSNNFEFSFTPQGNFNNGTWLDENGQNIGTPIISVAKCETRTVAYRYFDVSSNIFRYCLRKVLVCNPFDCKNMVVNYKTSSKTFSFVMSGLPAGITAFEWYVDDAKVSGNTLNVFDYVIPTPAPCKKQAITARYFDGEKWIICGVPVFVCDPALCGDNINFTYSKGKLDFGTKPNFDVIQWYINDVKANEKGNDIKPGTYTATVFYFDKIENYYNVCSKTIVLDDECFQDPNCDDISFYQSGSATAPLIYTFNTTNFKNITSWKVKKVGAANIVTLTNTTTTQEIDFSKIGGAGDYIVCAISNDGCCCIKIRIEDAFACKNINFQYNEALKSFELYSATANVTKVAWLLEDPGKAPKLLNANVLPLPSNCVSRLVSYRYFDTANQIWGYCIQNIFLCEPFACGEKTIYYAYDNSSGSDQFKFLLNDPDLPKYKDLSWQLGNGVPTALPIATDKSTSYYPAAGQDCKPYTIAAKYFNPAIKAWQLCAITVNICNPAKCNAINVDYQATAKLYQFSVPTTAKSKGYTWTIEELQSLIGDQAKTGYLAPSTLPCNNYTVAIRYYDGTAWQLCYKKMYLCDPAKCGGEINFAYDYDSAKDEGKLTLSTTATNVTNVTYYLDDDKVPAVSNAVSSGNYFVSVLYVDAQGVTKICSKKVQLVGGADKFTVIANKVTASPVQEAIIDLRVKNFINLANFQYTLTWDPKVIKLKAQDKLLVKGTTAFDVSQANDGFLGIKWTADNGSIGESYPDNAITYKIRFEVVGNIGSQSTIDFNDKVFAIKVTDNNNATVGFGKQTGSVTIATTAAKDITAAKDLFRIFPNPTLENATFAFDPNVVTIKSLALYNAQGQLAWQQRYLSANNGALELPMQNLANGLYFLRIETDKKVYSERVMKVE
jgi:Secretion system C-terminal sorting domain